MAKRNWKEYEHYLATLPGQAAADAPHWIVMGMSRHKELPEERRVSLYFRHPTEAAACAEAARMATLHPGKRFAVYAAGPAFKVLVAPVAPVSSEPVH